MRKERRPQESSSLGRPSPTQGADPQHLPPVVDDDGDDEDEDGGGGGEDDGECLCPPGQELLLVPCSLLLDSHDPEPRQQPGTTVRSSDDGEVDLHLVQPLLLKVERSGESEHPHLALGGHRELVQDVRVLLRQLVNHLWSCD